MPHQQGEKGGAGRRPAHARLAWALALALASTVACAQAGGPPNTDESPLRKFEKGAQTQSGSQPAASQPPGQTAGSGGSNDQHDDWLGDFLDFLFSPSGGSSGSNASGDDAPAPGFLAVPTDLTMARLNPRTDITLRRDDGDILIPYARYDFGYQQLSAGIRGYDNRFEAGFGVFSFLFEDYRLYDQNYGAALTLERYLMQYRVSVNRRSELDFGVGQTDLMGAGYTSLDTLSVAGRFMLLDNVLLEVRPVWARTVHDYDAALMLTQPYWSLKAGYRTMTSPGGTLQGPYLGFALHY
jgi:hypothetical protein